MKPFGDRFMPSRGIERLTKVLTLMRVEKRHVLIPVLLSTLVAFSSGMSIALLLPLIEGVREGGFEAVFSQYPSLRTIAPIFNRLRLTDMQIFMTLLFGLFFAQLLMVAVDYANRLYCHYAAGHFEKNLSTALFDRYVQFGRVFFDQASKGVIHSVFEAVYIIPLLVDYMRASLTSTFKLIVRLIILILLSWRLALLFIAAMPLLYMLIKRLNVKLKRQSMQRYDMFSDAKKNLYNILNSMSLIKAYALEKAMGNVYDTAYEKFRKEDFTLSATREFGLVFQKTLFIVVLMMIAIALSPSIFQGGLSEAIRYFVFLYAAEGMIPIFQSLVRTFSNFTKKYGEVTVVCDVFDVANDRYVLRGGSKPCPGLREGIDVKHLNYVHESSGFEIKDVSFSIRKGETVAIVGESGSGKTTVLHLIMRLYDSKESIFLDGVPIENFDVESFRRNFSYVAQDSILMHDSIRANLRFGVTSDVSDEDLIEACRRMNLSHLVSVKKDLDKLIGDNGILLSGGEQQRMAIARALLRDTEIMIFDEATSALDSKTEGHVQLALSQATRGRTSIIVAHRLSTVKNADKIIVMDGGTMVESGTWDELIARQGNFHELWSKQIIA